MKAMILAAGKGTRLLPLTATVPKALAPVAGAPFLSRLIAYLARHGVTELALNTHHLADALHAFLAEQPPPQPLRTFHEPVLLDTGGGILNARDFWGDADLLVWNGDICCALDPAELLRAHQSFADGQTLATLVLQDRPSDSQLVVDAEGTLCGIESPRRSRKQLFRAPVGEKRLRSFNGIWVLSPALRPHLEDFAKGRPNGAFDLIEAVLEAVRAGGVVQGWDAGAAFYGTTGSQEQLAGLEQALAADPALAAAWVAYPE